MSYILSHRRHHTYNVFLYGEHRQNYQIHSNRNNHIYCWLLYRRCHGRTITYTTIGAAIRGFKNPNDPELLIKFGTGRIAQILPKLDYMLSTGKQYTGFGFLHDDLTTNNQFVITNEFYTDVTQSEETVARVEVTQVQTILDAGLIGFLIQTFYYLAIYFWVLRPLPYSKSYLIVLFCISFFGIGGFAGLISRQGLLLLGLTTAAILLCQKQQTENINNTST